MALFKTTDSSHVVSNKSLTLSLKANIKVVRYNSRKESENAQRWVRLIKVGEWFIQSK